MTVHITVGGVLEWVGGAFIACVVVGVVCVLAFFHD